MHKEEQWRGWKKTIPVATIAPVIAPTCPPPLLSFTALKAIFSPSLNRRVSILTSSLPPRPMRRLGWASVIVAHATPPRGATITPCTLTSSKTSKSTVSPFLSVPEDKFRVKRSLTGVPSSIPNPASAGVETEVAAGGVFCGALADWEVLGLSCGSGSSFLRHKYGGTQ